jgi:hypothetical protein
MGCAMNTQGCIWPWHENWEEGEEWDEEASGSYEMSSVYLRLYLALDEDWDECDDSEWAAAWYCNKTRLFVTNINCAR